MLANSRDFTARAAAPWTPRSERTDSGGSNKRHKKHNSKDESTTNPKDESTANKEGKSEANRETIATPTTKDNSQETMRD